MTTDIQNLLCLLHCQAVTLLTAVLEPEEGLLIAATRRTRVKILPMFVSLSVSKVCTVFSCTSMVTFTVSMAVSNSDSYLVDFRYNRGIANSHATSKQARMYRP